MGDKSKKNWYIISFVMNIKSDIGCRGPKSDIGCRGPKYIDTWVKIYTVPSMIGKNI